MKAKLFKNIGVISNNQYLIVRSGYFHFKTSLSAAGED